MSPGPTFELDARVLEVLRACGPTAPVAVGRALGVDHSAVRRCLARMRSQGLVRRGGVTDAPRHWGMSAPKALWEATPRDGE